ncbi:MFS transporter [Candidatus Bathyarchaeota archaeon]|nr:MFS transporter [Candidatus Bathyarchaeota archaeon]
MASMSLKKYSPTYYLLCVIAFLMMLSTQITNPLLPLFAKQIGATGVLIGYAVAGYWVSRVILEIPSGFISARFGYFKPLLAGVLLTLIGNLLAVNVDSPFYLVVVRAIMGLGAPLFFAISMTFIINLFDSQTRGSAMGLFQGIEFIGMVIGSGMSGYVIEQLGFRGGFMLSSALALIALVLIAVPPQIRRDTREQVAITALKLSDIPEVIANRTLLLMAAITLAEFVMSSGLIYTIFPLYAEESLMIQEARIGYLMGARSIGFVVAMFTMGNLADRMGRRPILTFGIISTAILILVLSFVTAYFAMALIICLIGFTSGAIWIVGPVISAEAVKPDQRGAAIGTYRTFFDLGSVFGPIIMTAIYANYGVNYCFYLASGLLLLSMPLALLIRENRAVESQLTAGIK